MFYELHRFKPKSFLRSSLVFFLLNRVKTYLSKVSINAAYSQSISFVNVIRNGFEQKLQWWLG